MKKYLKVLFIFIISLFVLSIQKVYAAETHTVTFVTGTDDIVMEPFEVEDGDTINDKDINFFPKREGYSYPEWYTNESCTNEFDFEMKFYEDVTLYAKWIISIGEIRITSNITRVTDGEMLPEFVFSSETENVTFGHFSWMIDGGKDLDGVPGDIVDAEKNYQIYMSAKPADGYTLEGASVYFNGERVSTWIAWPLSMGGAEIGGTFFIPIEEQQSLEIIKGTDTYTIGETKEAEFEINADYNLFENGGEVFIDGSTEPLAKTNYSSREGSTIITLKESYVDTLSEGKHILKAVFNNDQAATTSFMVVKKASEEETKTENNTNNTTNNTTANKAKNETTPPPTGIDNPTSKDNILLYASLLVINILGLGSINNIFKRKYN